MMINKTANTVLQNEHEGSMNQMNISAYIEEN